MDYTVITSAVDLSAVLTGIGALGAIIMGIAAARYGVRKLIGMLR